MSSSADWAFRPKRNKKQGQVIGGGLIGMGGSGLMLAGSDKTTSARMTESIQRPMAQMFRQEHKAHTFLARNGKRQGETIFNQFGDEPGALNSAKRAFEIHDDAVKGARGARQNLHETHGLLRAAAKQKASGRKLLAAGGAAALVGGAAVADGYRKPKSKSNVRKAYDMPMVRDARGQFRGRMEMAPALMVQTDIALDNVDHEDEVEKAWSKSTKIQAGLGALGAAGGIAAGYKGHKEAQRLGPKTMKSLSTKEKVFGVRGGMARLAGTERPELSKAMNDAQRSEVATRSGKRNTARKIAATGLIGGAGALTLTRGGRQATHLLTETPKKVKGTREMLRGVKGTRGVSAKVFGNELKRNAVGAGTLGALGAGFGASNVSSYQTKKIEDLKAQGRRQRVAKGMPDGADVHIQGVLRPIGKLKKKA